MDVKQSLSKQFSIMMHKFIVAYGKALDPDISGSQVYMLEILQDEGTKKSSDVAAQLEISLPAVTNLANKLVKKGYIKRSVSAEDRRVTLLEITPTGSDVLKRILDKYHHLTETLWSGFAPEELTQLLQHYEKMVANLKHYQPDKE
ncbi:MULTISPECIES: MarR family winged helix-turn-helix transcriptional regulator [Brevibacillus]|jgi:DNA-binding MarR family transcriptional regulator|uniref:MarR family transcriptional regulator n=1 Tax=Brevibacillus borstelensis AK1 TaxID=1300222 RepID=M8DDP3_9BACL|nr:MarR family transcriptional regulator [Brevibacillus borstelensis]EMT51563.1 MarR family transcriptional regulator [Brevibacillus borstelensis AK1]MBE5395369.1 MarR family transcriptional regulator [Brevibacillus borstelensis]MCC0562821.1 MarR family transcriptional regulator [Brevibacillus borstelensis]MCM3468714.1 MarR family transcriptional regulator [Brevibacillus borstelensis]MCM3557089.1 MarR family transcriptional regulator [Brevibacillus borstelensis]